MFGAFGPGEHLQYHVFMNETEARRVLQMLRGELTVAQKRGVALEKLIDGYIELYPELGEDSASDEKPSTQDAIRQIFLGSPHKWFTVKLMKRELVTRGWLPESEQPESVIRTALSRLAAQPDACIHKSRGQKTGSITYSYRPNVEAVGGDADPPEN